MCVVDWFYHSLFLLLFLCYVFFNDTATTEIYTLSLHDALPISVSSISSHCWSSRPSRESSPSSTEPNPLCDRASRPRSRTIRPASGGGASATGAGPAAVGGRLGAAVAVPVRSAVAVPPPVPGSPALGGAGGAAWLARRRGRRKNRPPAVMATTATRATMMMIASSITAPVSQMRARAQASRPARDQRGRSGELGLPQALAHD